MKKLTAWQWVGIALSLVWIVGAGNYQHSQDIQSARSAATFAYNVCAQGKDLKHDSDLSPCERERDKTFALFIEGDVGSTVLLALAPIPFAWIFAYVFVGIVRSTAIGLRVALPWKEMSMPRKIFVTVGALTSAFAVLVVLMSVLNLYTDSLTPVALSPMHSVFQIGDTVVAEGTWTRTGSMGDKSKLADKLQTSKIYCMKSESRCVESRAYIVGGSNLLAVDQVNYNIQSWSPTQIVFTNEGPCFREVFTIDLYTKSVNGTGHSINSNSDFCHQRVFVGHESEWSYHLGDGFKVYWEARQKSRPIPLRVIQAFFGN
jgi:hypothetical protein